jgi:(heptosyl)LPS beta-1,4-glucosyltransferase
VPSLSLIVITKNEEEAIVRSLSSLNFVDDIVVVDSGSTDRAVELARAHGAQVVSTADWRGGWRNIHGAICCWGRMTF